MLVSVGFRVRIAGQNVRMSMAEQLLTPSQQVTGSIHVLGNDMLFSLISSFCNVHACASAYCILMTNCKVLVVRPWRKNSETEYEVGGRSLCI